MTEEDPSISRLKRLLRNAGRRAGLLAALLITFSLGYLLSENLVSEPATQAGENHAQADPEPDADEVWTCSMHPQIQLPKPGLCPLCEMPLILLEDGGMGGERRFTTTEAAKELMKIQTSVVERRFVPAKIRMVGKVDYDETKLGFITAWVSGRLDRLYVDYTGVEVKKGDHMMRLYSPELLAGQKQLRLTAERLESAFSEEIELSTKANLEALRTRLRRWGLTDSQIDEAERTGISSDHITVYAPMGGTVIHRNGREGMSVQEGTIIYTIADLSKVWLLLDAYESDLAWLHLGQAVEFTAEAYPGDVFTGKITFIDPVLDPTTRTIKVRVNVPNEDGRLKPEMFARAVVRAQVATGGRVMDPGLAGKWISPMHPEIVKDGPGACDICGMALVKAEDLGYVPAASDPEDRPLIIPASAPLLTGTRAVVYVEVPDQEKPSYDGREIVLGPRAGDYYVVRSGLAEGERVVTNGNFKIDSALQIMAKPSMMTPEGAGQKQGARAASTSGETIQREILPSPDSFRAALRAVVGVYEKLMLALSDDDATQTSGLAGDLAKAVTGVNDDGLTPEATEQWARLGSQFESSLDSIAGTPELSAQRVAFEDLSLALRESIETFGLNSGPPVQIANCFMAMGDRGADWLQFSDSITNPYLGKASGMLKCGDLKLELVDEDGHQPHGQTQ